MQRNTYHGAKLALALSLLATPALAQKVASPFAEKSPAQEILGKTKSYAFVNCKVYTGKKGKNAVLQGVTVLISGGCFEKIGKDLEVPASYERIEGGVLLPGLIHPASRAGIKGGSSAGGGQQFIVIQGRRFRLRGNGRPGGGKAQFAPTSKVASKIDPLSADWAKMLRWGITTVAVRPNGIGFPGQAAIVRPGGKPKDMILKDDSYLWMGAGIGSAAKSMLRANFDKAKKLIAERKKPKAAAKPTPKPAAKPAAKPTAKPTPAKKEAKKPAPKPAPKPSPKAQPKPAAKKPAPKAPAKKPAPKKEDPRIAILADVLEGKRKIVLSVNGATTLLHAQDALRDVELALTIFYPFQRGATKTIDRVLKASKKKPGPAPLLLPPELAYKPFTAIYYDLLGEMRKRGHELMIFPGGDRQEAPFWFKLGQLVQAGHRPVHLIASMSSVPAKWLGIDKRVGSIEAGKDANLIHFDRDPFSPAAQRQHVLFEGREVTLRRNKEKSQ